MVRIGILGAGAMGAAHAAAYSSMPDVEVVGIFARGQDGARSVASICKAKPFASADALAAEVDAIDVCLPTAWHPEFVIAAFDRGKHVFFETPLALDLQDAIDMPHA